MLSLFAVVLACEVFCYTQVATCRTL